MLSPGSNIDRYTVESVIGHGGTSVVYLVRHNQLGSKHALKVLSLTSGSIRQRLLREGRVQAALHHANIVTVTDVLDVDGAPGLLMEYIDGPALDQAMRKYKITLNDALILFRGVVAGVRGAHAEGLVHRDLKPANVMLFRSPEGFIPKVTDFGLAKILVGRGAELGQTRQGIAMGTPAYMSPEQIHDARAVDQRADIFSLGCILYELATRGRAFPGDQALEIYNNIVAGRYTPPEELNPDLPDEVIRAIDGCLITDRDLRIPDCDTILQVLDGAKNWEIVNHPVPNEVLPTEEVDANAPNMRIATTAGPNSITQTLDDGGALSVPPESNVTLSEQETIFPAEKNTTRRRIAILAMVVACLIAGATVAAILAIVLGLFSGDDEPSADLDAPTLEVDGATRAAGPVSGIDTPMPEEPTEQAVSPEPPKEIPPTKVVTQEKPEVTPVDSEVAEPLDEPLRVVINSNPYGARVLVDGRDRGLAPQAVTVSPGAYKIEVIQGDKKATKTIQVGPNEGNKWCFDLDDGAVSPGFCG